MSEGTTERKDMLRRAETRWMSVEDAEITVSARELALLGRALAAAEERAEKAEAALREILKGEPDSFTPAAIKAREGLAAALAAASGEDAASLASPPGETR